jgi:6-pyruvoyltetrahydropterin/6-carboxytetrahydropterin synthase
MPDGHKCRRVHGHTYHLEVVVSGNLREDGTVCDFANVKGYIKQAVTDHLDHRNLNDLMKNPTAEHLVEWIHGNLRHYLPPNLRLESLTLWETPNNAVEWRGL